MVHGTRFAGMAVVCSCVFSTFVVADEPNEPIATFLESTWPLSSSAKAETEAKFASLRAKVRGDVRVHYANTLVCIQQRRFEDAAKSADDAIELDSTYLPAWQAKVWLALLNKQYGAALAATERMGEIVVKNRDKTPKERNLEAARFLGVVFGYIEGPVGDNPATVTHKSIERQLLLAFSATEVEEFKDARQTVVEKFQAFLNDKAETKDKAIADEEAEKQHKIEDVAKRREEIARESEANRKQQKDLETKYQQQLGELTKADAPLATQLNAAETRAFSVNQQLNQLQGEIGSLEVSIAREKNPVARAVLQTELNRVNRLATRYDSDLFILNQNLQGIAARRNELLGRKQALDQEIGGQLKSIERKLSGYASEERKLENIERQARKPSTGSGKGTAIGLTAKALNTYEPFPLEREKAKLLDSLR